MAPPGRTRAPGWAVWLLIVVATAVAMSATLNSWLDRQVLETDEWVEVSDRLLDDEDIRDALATFLVAELFREIDVADGLEQLLPDAVGGLAGPLAATLEGNAVGVADRLLASSAVSTAWTELNQRAHSRFVAILRDETPDSISTADGTVVFDAGVLVTRLGERLGLPDRVLDRIPEDAGTFVVFESDQLDAMQQVVAVVDVMSVYLFVVVIVLYALAVWLAGDRRVALRNVGVALTVGGVLLLVARRITVRLATEQLAEASDVRSASNAIVTIATNLLDELAWAGVALGVVVALYAVVIGPSRPAVVTRRALVPVASRPVATWALAVLALLVFVAVLPGFSAQHWLPALVFAVLFVAAVEGLRRHVLADSQAAGDQSEETPSAVGTPDTPSIGSPDDTSDGPPTADTRADTASPVAGSATTE